MTQLTALISSPPDRENVVLEIWFDNRQFAEISKEPGRDFEIEIYADANGPWHFDLRDLMRVLESAERNLGTKR